MENLKAAKEEIVRKLFDKEKLRKLREGKVGVW